ncbi:MAG: hypothetical protein ABIN36_14610 [Ferruginibacter sp.]
MKRVFGLKEISGKVNEYLFKQVKNKHEPENWKWKPHNPEKIKKLKDIIEREKESVNYACISNYAPSTERQKVVLIFACGNLSYGLIDHLENAGIKYFFLEYTQLIAQGKISIRIENDIQVKLLTIQELVLNLDDVSAVIWNPPKMIKPLFDFNHIPATKGRNSFMYKKRWVQFLRELPLLLKEEVAWIPGVPMNGSQEWQNKIGEYQLAKSVGLKVAPILFTNSLEDLQEFARENGNRLLIREFSTPPFSFPPVPLNITKISFENFSGSPSCFQKYVDKQYELRVVILFDKVYPCKIHSQNSELAKNDWRVYDDENVKWELVEIPNELTEKLLLLNKKLELTWTSVDLIYGVDDQYYFLEANRPGAHYWLDPFVGLDITKEIVKELADRNYTENIQKK